MAASTHGSGSGGHGSGLSPYELILLVFIGAVVVYIAREFLSAWWPADAGEQVIDGGADRLRSLVAPLVIILIVAASLLFIARRVRKRREYLRRRYVSAVRPVMPRTYKGDHLQVRRWFVVTPRKITLALPPECEVENEAWRDRVVTRLTRGVGEPLTARWPRQSDPLLRAQPRVVVRPQRKGIVHRVLAVLR